MSPHLYPKHYDGDVGAQNTKCLSTTGAEYGCRSCFSSGKLGSTQHQTAFTLAEILITLSIIGVVAALTIPGLIVKNQEKETVVRVKKAYSVFSNAFNLAKIQYGDPEFWAANGYTNDPHDNFDEKLSTYFNLIKHCNHDQTGCWDSSATTGGIFADGMAYRIWSEGGSCNTQWGIQKLKHGCGGIMLDINSNKKPNEGGKDTFGFFITQEGIVPGGSYEDTRGWPLKTDCRGNSKQGCTAWVILKENLEYPPNGIGWE